MFGRRLSVHGRLMGDVRSAQQKCVRRGMLEPLISLHLEHLLSEPDFSLAAMKRAQVIAAEDIGVGALGLLPALVSLMRGWSSLSRRERARRLIQTAHMMVSCEASRFVPCWVITLLKGVDIPVDAKGWRSLDELYTALEDALDARELQDAGLLIEELFLRHSIEKEADLPAPLCLPKGVMGGVWDRLERFAKEEHRDVISTMRRCFGTPSQESTSSRLFLYLAVVTVILAPEVRAVAVPWVEDEEVDAWIGRAEASYFPIPMWMYDRHTREGRRLKRGYAHFFETSVQLTNPSDILGLAREEETRDMALSIYLAEEENFGRSASSSHIRRRWREAAGSRCEEVACTH